MGESTTASAEDHQSICNAYANFDFQIPAMVVGVICSLTGIVYCFFGYRFFKAVLFLSGFLFASVLIYLVCDREHLLPTLGNAGVAVGAGVLFGLVTMLVQYVGVFMSGFLTGLLGGTIIMLIWLSTVWSPPATIWTSIGVLFGTGLLFALVSLKWQRSMIILNTALLGGALLGSALDYFADHAAILERMWEAMNVNNVRWMMVCWYGWLVLAVWPVLFAVGAAVQWRWTSVGYDHKEGWRQFRRRRSTPESGARCCVSTDRPRTVIAHGRGSYCVTTTSTGQSPIADPFSVSNGGKCYQPRSWRSIYQSRRRHGDVICQKYLGRLHHSSNEPRQRESLPGQGSSTATPTLASDQTRLTALTNESIESDNSGKGDSDKSP